jgi:hypothetical protein
MNAMLQYLMSIVGDTYVSLSPRPSIHVGASSVPGQSIIELLGERDESKRDPEAPTFSDEEIEGWLEDPTKFDPWYLRYEKK